MPDDTNLLTLTADIVAAHLANNTVAVNDVPEMIRKVHDALRSLSARTEQAPEEKKGLVSVRASIKPDYLVCMECGAKQKTLKRHLARAHNMTPAEYRKDYGLPDTYPMVAPEYAEKRRDLAKSIGLGRKAKPNGVKGKQAQPK